MLEKARGIPGATVAPSPTAVTCLASKYAGRPICYFGEAIPARFAEIEIPVLCRIRLTHVVALDPTDGAGGR